jgi:hypothetical protein
MHKYLGVVPMNEASIACEVASRVFDRGGRVVLHLSGHHDEYSAWRCAAEISRRIGPRRNVELVVDISDLDGLTARAQQVWASVMPAIVGRLGALALVGGTPLARRAAAAACLSAGIELRMLNAASGVHRASDATR